MNHRDRISIIGAGGHAKVVAATLLDMGLSIGRFYDIDESKWGNEMMSGIIISPIANIKTDGGKNAIIAIGDNQARENIAMEMKGIKWITAVHSKAYVHSTVRIGRGTVIFAGVIIQPDVVIGDHCIINTGAVIDHDCVIGSYSHVAPGVRLAGGAQLGSRTLVGVGSVLAPGVSVGDNAVVGAGSVVVADLPSNITAYGVPAKVRR